MATGELKLGELKPEQAFGPKNIFEGNNWELPTDISLVDQVEEALDNRLKEAGWDEDNIFGLGLGLREALINAMGHGNLGIPSGTEDIYTVIVEKQKQHPTDKKVYVTLEISSTKVVVTVLDEGEGFDYNKVADPTDPAHLLEGEGRGLSYMKNFYDSVQYKGKGNEVVMTKTRVVNPE